MSSLLFYLAFNETEKKKYEMMIFCANPFLNTNQSAIFLMLQLSTHSNCDISYQHTINQQTRDAEHRAQLHAATEHHHNCIDYQPNVSFIIIA